MSVFGASGSIPDTREMVGAVSRLEELTGATIQVFRADRVFGREHLERAVELAQRNWDRGNASARTLGMEVMLFAAAERQINHALDKLGAQPGTGDLAIVAVGDIDPQQVLAALNLERDDAVLEPRGKDHSIFSITPLELSVADINELVLERMALSQLTR